jgi:SOS response regulatory protein OraA/RecX
MRAKLSGLRADSADVEEVLAHLQEVGLLNDADYAYNFALRRINEMAWGDAKVYHSLVRRHIASHLAESAIQKVHQEVGEEEVLARYLGKVAGRGGMPTDRKGIRKLIAHLRSRGFSEDHIWRCLRERVPAANWRRFESGD